MPKAIFFDAVGTLIYLTRSVGEHYCEVAHRFGAMPDPHTVNHAFKDAWTSMSNRGAVINTPREDDDKGWWRDLVCNVMHRSLGEEEARSFDMTGYFEAVYAHFTLPGVWEVFDDVSSTLHGLRKAGIPLGVISNFDRRLYRILETLKLREFFQGVIVSSEVGAEKPDPTIFRTALATLQVTGHDSLHVGDDLHKDGGASTVGMRTFHVIRPGQGLHQLLESINLPVSG